jgi:4-amino-4-deoxy-L-arabinose transferase-like glycosyltransferase
MPPRPVATTTPARRFRKRLIWLLICAAAVYLIGNESVPLWDRDEPRYAQTSRQMLQSDDWVVPRFLDQVRTAKPPFIYWCQANAMKLLRSDGAFAARLPSAIAMVATIGVLAWWLRGHVGRRRAIWCTFIFASSGLVIAAGKMCLTDSVLLLWVTVAQICLYEIMSGRGTWMVWIAMGAAVGCAGLTKGPVVLGVMGTTLVLYYILGWKRRERARGLHGVDWGRSGVAIAIIAIICAPWVLLIHHREPQFLPRILGHDVLNRISSGLEGHKGPPGYYLLLIWVTYFPWSLFLPGAIAYAWRHRGDRLTRFALASVIGPWVMFEIVQTKLPHYVLPIFPWLALLTARMLVYADRPVRMELRNKPFLLAVTLWCGIVTLLCASPMFASLLMPTASVIVMLSLAIAAVGFEWSRSVFMAFRRGKPLLAGFAMGAGTLLIVGLAYGGFLPFVPDIQTSRRVAQILREEGATQLGSVIMIDYKEPSLAFYQGGTIREESNDQYLAQTNPLLWPRWIVLTRRIWDSQPPEVRGQLEPIGAVNGWWYPKGRRVEVLVVRKR